MENLPVHPALRTALTTRGYAELTPVQLAMLSGEHSGDLLVSAQTGSGKTVAFGIAISSSLLGDEARFGLARLPLGLVVAPTRELALQVQRELDWLYADAGIVTASSVGGLDARTERRALDRGAHIVVGTPGRLRDHITRGALDLSDIRAIVLDEADEMLDLGFREDLEFILAAAPEDRRTLMFSATVPPAIAKLARTFQKDATRVTATAASERHADIEYMLMPVQSNERENAIINTLLYYDDSNALVFCHTREAVKHLTARLSNRGFSVVALSGELSQGERTNALQAMRDGRARVCVATDVAARGIDLPNLDLVIHADLPTNPDTLLHRSGRTGRAGRKGICVLVVPVHRRGAAARVLKLANLDAATRPAPTIAQIDLRYREQVLETARSATPPDESEAQMVADLLAVASPEVLAAAYLRQQLAKRPAGEDVSDAPIPAFADKAPRRDKRLDTDGAVEREPRQPDMVGGVWFTLSLGRKHRADPKWLLPMICKAGGVTKRDVGSIKILDTSTRFEIAADKATAFSQQLVATGRLEKGVVIAPEGSARPEAYARPEPHVKREPRPKHEGSKHEASAKPKAHEASTAPAQWTPESPVAPRYKVRTDKGEKLDGTPKPKRNFAEAPKSRPKPKFKGPDKDKGKPKYKKRAAPAA